MESCKALSGIRRFRELSMMILLGMITADARSSIHEGKSPQSLPVTVALDWLRLVGNPADKKNLSLHRRIQNDYSGFGYPKDSQDDPFLDTALGIADDSMTNSSTKGLSVIGILVVVLVSIAVIFAVLLLRRRHEVKRWREYRTHQVLRAQDEAFDMSYDEAFDLELIEGEMS